MAKETRQDQSTVTQQKETSGQQGSTQSATGGDEQQRPIASSREGGRGTPSNTGMVQQRGGAPVRTISTSPFALMQRMSEDMDRLFDQFGFGRTALTPQFGSLLDSNRWSGRGVATKGASWSPQVEIFRRGDNLVIRADIPGVNKEDVHVEIENDMLTISGERQEEHNEEHDGFYRSERSYGQFYRAIPLPEGVNSESCEASFKEGVLEVTLPAPKQQERKAKQIRVK